MEAFIIVSIVAMVLCIGQTVEMNRKDAQISQMRAMIAQLQSDVNTLQLRNEHANREIRALENMARNT